MKKNVQKYIVVVPMWSLSNIRSSLKRGAVIEYDAKAKTTTIDGKTYDDVKDILIAIDIMERNPSKTIIEKYSDEKLKEVKTVVALKQEKTKEQEETKKKPQHLVVIQSDADLMQTDIDIAHTQIGRISREAKEAERKKAKNENLEVVSSYVSPEEIVKKIHSTPRTNIPIVRDDSLSNAHSGDSSGVSLNSGSKVSGKGLNTPESKAKAIKAAEMLKKEALEKKNEKSKKRAEIVVNAETNEDIMSSMDLEQTPSAEIKKPTLIRREIGSNAKAKLTSKAIS